MRIHGRLVLTLLAALVTVPASALDYRTVDVPAAILYDTPSLKGKRLYIVRQAMPLEVVVRLDGWFKVRDAEGSLAWIESRALVEKRTVVVTAPRATVRKEAKDDAAPAFEAEKWVALELVEAGSPGWARVRHRDGTGGFIKSTTVWGL